MLRKLATGLAVAALVLAGTATSYAQTGTTPPATGSKAGVLNCHVSSGFGFILASSRDLNCTFSPEGSKGAGETYSGKVTKVGADIGYVSSAVILWAVVAAGQVQPGALAGTYAGVTGSASVGVGVGANVLVGGSNKSITLQPISIEGGVGLNVAAGIESISLSKAN
jgi:hypothetical protein